MYSSSKIKYILPILLAMLIMVGCKHHNEPELGDVIVFSAQQIEPKAETRANGLEHVHTDFKVYGYKVFSTVDRGGKAETVFNGYRVWHTANTAGTTTSNTADWEYVNDGSQSIKYWDYESTYYYFLGYSPAGSTDVVVTETIDNTDRTTDASVSLTVHQTLTAIAPSILVSKPHEVNHIQMLSEHQVRMEFMMPMAKVRIGFFASDYSLPPYALTNISFAPTAGDIQNVADVKFTYPIRKYVAGVYQSGELEVQTVPLTTPNTVPSLTYLDCEGLPKHGSPLEPTTASNPVWAYPSGVDPSATPELIYYYTFPQPGSTPWELSMKIKDTDDAVRIAVVPAEYVRWEPNKVYTYLFKVSATAIVLEVVKVDEWTVFEVNKTVTTW